MYDHETAANGYHVKGKAEGSKARENHDAGALKRLRISHLHLLELLVEHGTVRKAAEALDLSQPAVSQMLKDLEAAFGGALFSRTRKGVLPNARLEALLRRVRIVLGELHAVQAELSGLPKPTIRIGANLQFLTQHVPTALARVWSTDPNLRYVLREGSTRALIEALLRGDLDCAIGPTHTLTPQQLKELRFWTLYDSDLCLVVNPSHRLAGRKRVSIADLADEPWVLGNTDGHARQTVERAFVAAGFTPPAPVLECRPHLINMHFVSKMPFVTVAGRADAAVAEKAGTVRILALSVPLEFGPVALICRKSSSEDAWLTRFREEAMASIKLARRKA